MTTFDSTITNLHKLLDYQARKFTAAEVQLNRGLRIWMEKAGSVKLKTVLQKYLDLIEMHAQKLEEFFDSEQINSLNRDNRVMKAFTDETAEMLDNCTDTEVRDACLLASIQCVNHYKISVYGTAAAFAKELEMEKFAALFHEFEVNEKQIDDRLSQLAFYEINSSAKKAILIP